MVVDFLWKNMNIENYPILLSELVPHEVQRNQKSVTDDSSGNHRGRANIDISNALYFFIY